MLKKRLFLALASLAFGSMLLAAKTDYTTVTSFNNAPAFECAGGGSETFSNLGSSASSYATRTWTGNNSVTWSATDARTDQSLNGTAIALRTSVLKNTSVVTGGVGTVSFNYKRVFTGNSTLKLFVNGVQYGADIAVSSDVTTAFTQTVNVAGNAVIELRNTTNRIIVDDLTWTCYAAPVAGPELQLTNTANVNQACGAFAINFSSQGVNTNTDAVFNIKNLGTSALSVTSLTLSNTADFSIVSPIGAFTVAPSASAIVLVRFNTASAGAKTGTLTINNNDTDEAACVVTLSGTGIEPCTAPVIENAVVVADSISASSAGITVSNAVADKYLAVITTASSLSAVPANATTYNVGDAFGGGTVAYNGTAAEFNLSGLNEVTAYNVFVYPYNTTNCSGGPVYFTQDTISTGFTTLKAPCIGGAESFANIGTAASAYATRTWTGDNNISWSATDARTDQTLNGKAIALREGKLTNTVPVSGGINTLTFNYKRVFTGNSTLKVFVNGVQYGGDITVSLDTATQFSQDINVQGPVTVSIENSGNRIIVDDIAWGCYAVPANQELQLLDSTLAPKACGALALNFGTAQINTAKDTIFSIKNLGLTALDVQNLTLSDTLNYSIVAPVTLPFTVDSLATQQVIVRFNSATAGTYPATLVIASNDEDEASCTINLTAIAQGLCVAPVTGDATVTNITSNSADIEFTSVGATGHIAILSLGSVPAPVNGTSYTVGSTYGDGTVVYAGTGASFTVSDLDASTVYSLTVYAYNNTDCFGGPVYSEASTIAEIETTEVTCTGGTETFTNIGTAATAYSTRTWTGDNAITWTATDSRNDQLLSGSKAITLRTGYVSNTTAITGGIGTLTFKYARAFTNNSTLKVYVNDVQYGADITVSLDTPTVFTQTINVAADATIKIVNSGNRSTIDDVTYTCYQAAGARKALSTNNVNDASSQNVTVYPNPSNGRFQVSFGTSTANVAVYNVLGEMVINKTVNNNEVVDLSGASKGLYMVTVTAGGKATSHKVIVQ